MNLKKAKNPHRIKTSKNNVTSLRRHRTVTSPPPEFKLKDGALAKVLTHDVFVANAYAAVLHLVSLLGQIVFYAVD